MDTDRNHSTFKTVPTPIILKFYKVILHLTFRKGIGKQEV